MNNEELTNKEKFYKLADEEIAKASYSFDQARVKIRELAAELEIEDMYRAVKIAQLGVMETRWENEQITK